MPASPPVEEVSRAATAPSIDGLNFAATSAATGGAQVIQASAGSTPPVAVTAPRTATAPKAASAGRNIGEGTLRVIALDAGDVPVMTPPTEAPATAAPAAADPRDMRRVTGTRVNMRNGPGITYGVLAQLVEGETVEVLRDGGNGWVKLRTEESGRIGWMAASLLAPVQ
ncbi:SH3 domain-containing protein [Pseudooceanicola sp. LIPI14-2-Ac024]|uniref:SH3 domain-containing protein n=1 Tax=Pseudooceanicola sp. LIPI14-2-Ac024 TaxID=3344875 RepID=UPI0035D0F7BD